MDALKTIRTKHAVRRFSDQPVPDEVIREILDAGHRSQSSKNTQPWQFIVLRDRDTLTALSKLGTYAGHLAGATFAIVLVASEDSRWNAFDLGQASSYFQLAAHALGVGACIATIYPEDDVKALLGIPADRSVYCALSFGYPAADWTPAKMGGRKPLEEVVRWEHW